MKKYIIVLFLLVFIIPSVAFAFWWNPFSWKIFSHKIQTPSTAAPMNVAQEDDINTKPLDSSSEEIQKLKQQIQDLEKKQYETSIAEKKVIKETKKDIPVVDNSEIIKKQVQAELEATLKIKAEQDALLAKQEQEKINSEKANDVFFKVEAVRQTIFNGTPDYGGYEIEIRVTTGKDDIYIPLTTTDSTKSITGFEYSIKGSEFRGDQSSKVDCGTSKYIREVQYCLIQKGKSVPITATVWLVPMLSGNYGLIFEKMNYLKGNNYLSESFDINRETQKIYLK